MDERLLAVVSLSFGVGETNCAQGKVALSCRQKPLLTKQLWFTHNIGNRI